VIGGWQRPAQLLAAATLLLLPLNCAGYAVVPPCHRAASASRTAGRTSGVSLLEAFDLLPVIDCLKLDEMDKVQVCMDALQPWMVLDDVGGIQFTESAANGFIGGSVGVVGTVIAAQVKKDQVKGRLKCNYCEGTGQILCGHCLGTGTVSFLGPSGELETQQCQNCEGTGTVVCINCQGSGLSVPDDFLQMLGDDDMGFSEDDFIGLFDETPMGVGAQPKREKQTTENTPPSS